MRRLEHKTVNAYCAVDEELKHIYQTTRYTRIEGIVSDEAGLTIFYSHDPEFVWNDEPTEEEEE